MSLQRLRNKTIVVTGSASGIGAACVQRLCNEGATVVAADINESAGREVVEQVSGEADFVTLDVTAESSWEGLMQHVEDKHTTLQGIVNVAGIAAEIEDLEGCSLEDWHRVMRVNLDGTFLGCRYALPLMRGCGGSIVNIASIIGLIGDGNMMAYGASKGGVRLLSRSIAVQCCAKGYAVRCNSIHPGYIETPLVTGYLEQRQDPQSAREALIQKHPIGRLGQPHEVAALVAFLQSEESSFVTGAELTIDGGYTTA